MRSTAVSSTSKPLVDITRSSEIQDQRLRSNLRTIQHILFIMSGKGGVGKSSVTANLAVTLALKGYHVGILDVDLHGPSIPRLLGLSGDVTADKQGRMIPVVYNDKLSVVSMDSFLDDKDTAIVWKGPKKISAIRQFLTEVAWGTLDFLLIDSPPGTGDEHMAVLSSIPEAKCIVVTTPQEISLADVRKALDFLRQIKASILGIVENMSGLACPSCGYEIEIFKKGGGVQLAKQEGLEVLGTIPLDPVAVLAADCGNPIVCIDVESKAKQGFFQVVETMLQSLKNVSATCDT